MKAETQIQSFILNNLSKHQRDIIKAAIGKFGISRQAVLKHMNTLIREKKVVAYGKTKDRYYELEPILNYSRLFKLAKDTKVDHFLQNEIIPNLKKIGLLHDDLVPEYEKLGVMGYADGDSDYETSWEELSKPLDKTPSILEKEILRR